MNKPEECRKYPRLRREERVVIRRLEGADDDPAQNVRYCKAVDISPAGLQARAKRELRAGESLELVVNVEGYENSFHLRGETHRCRPANEDGACLPGIEIPDVGNSDFLYWRRIFN